MDGRRLFHPRGKLLGGSSSVNAMVYVRGHAEDYNRWAFKEGATGWSYEECLPYFVKSEVVACDVVKPVALSYQHFSTHCVQCIKVSYLRDFI